MSIVTGRDAGGQALFEPKERARLARFLASPWLTAGLVLLAIAQQAVGHIDIDVSWLVTLAEKYLDGQVPYAEVMEVNPPVSFLSLVPAVLVARALHVAVEPVVVAFVTILGCSSLWLSGFILRFGAARSIRERGLLLNGGIYLFLVVPEITFAEREHFALLTIAPMLAGLAVYRGSGRLPLTARLCAGVGAAIAISFKPIFVLAIIVPALAIAWRERSFRVFFTMEMWTAAVLSIVHVAAIGLFFPAYFSHAAPLVLDVYTVARESVQNFLAHTLAPVYLALSLALMFLARGSIPRRETQTALWASLGFFACFILQGKGWINHAYPAVALVFLAWLSFLFDQLRLSRKHAAPISDHWLVKFFFIPALFAAPAFFGAANQLANIEEHPGLRDAILRYAPPRPRMIALAFQPDIGHPVARQVGATWVGRQSALWISASVGYLWDHSADGSPYRARLANYRREDVAIFAEDVERAKPDVILVEDARIREWAARQPETADVLASYERAANARDVEIWTRRAN